MKNLFCSFLTLFLFSFLLLPTNAFAQTEKAVLPELNISEALLNGNEPFSTIQNEEAISVNAASGLDVTLSKRSGLLEGNWIFSTHSPITYANLSFYIQYKKNWFDISWTTKNTVSHVYPVYNSPLTIRNQKSWSQSAAGQYRVCLTGSVTRIAGVSALYGCSGAVSHSGGIIIARTDIKEENEKRFN